MENQSTVNFSEGRSFYPGPEELLKWIDGIYSEAEARPVTVETEPGFFWHENCGCYHAPVQLLKFSGCERPFRGIWQPKTTGAPAPLLVHLPGYGGEIAFHPDVAAEGYNLLHLSPLGYWTPEGFDYSLMRDGNWPVLPDTVITRAQGGYRSWLLDCVCAVRFAMSQSSVLPGRVSFYGTSQGGGAALLLGSIFSGRGTACVAADQPFLTNFPLSGFRYAYTILAPVFEKETDRGAAWRALGFIDTLSHAERMNYPVLLTSGGRDEGCRPDTIASLFEKLPQTRSLLHLHDQPHGANREFIKLACAWFSLWA